MGRRANLVLLWLVVLFAIVILAASRARLWMPRPGGVGSPAKASAARIAYLSPSQAPELWTIAPDGSQTNQLSETGGRVYDYSIAPDSTRILFSAYNEQNGIDLWEIPRQGGQPFLLLPCGSDWCFNPSYAPDGSKIAYSRRKASGLPGSQPGAPQVWLIERTTLQTDVLFVDLAIGGHSPLWSPDGRYLAFVDDLQQGVRVVDFLKDAADEDGDFFLETGPGDSFSWAPDSRRLFLTQTQTTGEYLSGRIYMVDTVNQQASLWLGEEDVEYSVPAWEPGGEWAVVARRGFNQGPGRQLWLVSQDGSQREAISADPRANHASYHWDPTGAQLVFQRLEFAGSSNVPEVWVWSRTDNQFHQLAADAFLPRWLP